MVYFGSNLGDASTHGVKNLPVLLAGGGLRHGQHLAFGPEEPAAPVQSVLDHAPTARPRNGQVRVEHGDAHGSGTGRLTVAGRSPGSRLLQRGILGLLDRVEPGLSAALWFRKVTYPHIETPDGRPARIRRLPRVRVAQVVTV